VRVVERYKAVVGEWWFMSQNHSYVYTITCTRHTGAHVHSSSDAL